MTDTHNRDGRHRTSTTAVDGSLATRRDVLKAAGIGAGALAFGPATWGTVGAQQIPTPWLHVDGNLVTDPDGATVKLRGFNIADPKRMSVEAPAIGKTAVQAVEYLTDPDEGWYPRVVRVPVQPIDVGEHMPGHIAGPPEAPAFTVAQLEEYISTYLDPVVDACEERGVYCIVDYHRHWGDGEFEWDQPALVEEVDTFWDVMAPHYADRSHVLYEVYNEPTEPGIWGTPDGTENDHWTGEWRYWKETAQPWVETIRAHAPENLVLIGSPSWTQSPEGALIEPFDGENLAYTYHIYPGHNVSMTGDWAEAGVNGEGTNGVYEEHPLFVTEFGWETLNYQDHDAGAVQYLSGTVSSFGQPFMDFLESSDAIHWTAWCAHPTWLPSMFERPFVPEDAPSDPYEHPYQEAIPAYCSDLPCDWALLGRDVGEYDDHMGEFVRETLEALKDDGIPGGDVEPPACDGIEVGEYCATDPDGDGRYRDVNGNDNNDFQDVVAFFEEMNGDGVQSNVSAFDFNENGGIDFADVTALFEQV